MFWSIIHTFISTAFKYSVVFIISSLISEFFRHTFWIFQMSGYVIFLVTDFQLRCVVIWVTWTIWNLLCHLIDRLHQCSMCPGGLLGGCVHGVGLLCAVGNCVSFPGPRAERRLFHWAVCPASRVLTVFAWFYQTQHVWEVLSSWCTSTNSFCRKVCQNSLDNICTGFFWLVFTSYHLSFFDFYFQPFYISIILTF